MTIDEKEIRATVRRLQREGKFDRYASEDADLKAERVATMRTSLDLTDAEVDRLWDGLEETEANEIDHEILAARAVARAHTTDEVPARELDQNLVQRAGADELRQRVTGSTDG